VPAGIDPTIMANHFKEAGTIVGYPTVNRSRPTCSSPCPVTSQYPPPSAA